MKRRARAKAKTNNPKSIGYIYRLPNELLHLVFTFLFLSEDTWESRSPTAIFGERVLVLRWVCAWFRTIASQHNRWLEDDFDFQELFPPPKKNRLPAKYVISGSTSTLLDDRTLRSCLGRRSSWNFSSDQVFFAVQEMGSSFLRNTRRLQVKDVGYGLPLMMTKFGVFTSLTSITITIPVSEEVAINLDAIAQLCPLLEDVALYSLCRYMGSLEGLQHVTSLSVELADSWGDWFEMLGFTDLLPVDSASCLTRLSFRIQRDSPLYFNLEDNPFDSFVALTDLTIHEFHPGLFQQITTTKVSLLNLTISISAMMINCPLTRKELQFEAPLDLSWCRLFSEMSNLSEMLWRVTAIFGEWNGMALHGRNDHQIFREVEARAKRAFKQALDNGHQKTLISVTADHDDVLLSQSLKLHTWNRWWGHASGSDPPDSGYLPDIGPSDVIGHQRILVNLIILCEAKNIDNLCGIRSQSYPPRSLTRYRPVRGRPSAGIVATFFNAAW
jgi:hypothetical protein